MLGDRKKLATLFTEAGVASASVTTHQGKAKFPDIRSMVESDLRGWLPGMGIVLPEDQIHRILEAAEQSLSSYITRAGAITFDSSAHIVTGTKRRIHDPGECAYDQ